MGNDRLEPYILVTDHENTIKATLIVDKRVIDDVSGKRLPFALMSSFFVFNICYPKGCNNFYSMLEVLLLNFSCEKLTTTCKNLLPKIMN